MIEWEEAYFPLQDEYYSYWVPEAILTCVGLFQRGFRVVFRTNIVVENNNANIVLKENIAKIQE